MTSASNSNYELLNRSIKNQRFVIWRELLAIVLFLRAKNNELPSG